jgi:hypothetical protein
MERNHRTVSASPDPHVLSIDTFAPSFTGSSNDLHQCLRGFCSPQLLGVQIPPPSSGAHGVGSEGLEESLSSSSAPLLAAA